MNDIFVAKKPKTYVVKMAIMEGLYDDPSRLKAYASTANRILFRVRWNRKAASTHCLRVYTVENVLLGYIRVETEEIRRMFINYSDPIALLIARNHDSILFDLFFSKDKEYLDELKRQNGFAG